MLKLVSYKLCPYVQRALIALIHKGAEHEVVYIDLAEPPDWYLKISPLKKVPLLVLGDVILFESVAITEYIDEAYPGKLHPDDMVLRAQNRSWIGFGESCMPCALHLSTKETETEFEQVVEDLCLKFDALENAIQGDKYFNADEFSLVDVNYAPLLMRLEFLNRVRPGVLVPNRHKKINRWKDILLNERAVTESCVPEMEILYKRLLRKRRGYISHFLDDSFRTTDTQRSVY